jgi:glycosyltransferase involved in cell wall biosynthesis
MLKNKTVAVVVPAYNEESQIGIVIETMPNFVDRIVIVNDLSNDKTKEVIESYIKKGDKVVTKILDHLEKIQPTKFNYADIVAQNMLEEEESLYTKFEIISNPHSRIILINFLEKGNVGRAYATGYKWCRDHNIDCTAIMDGDGQMDPSELEGVCMPVIDDIVDTTKVNRLSHPAAVRIIPKVRHFGNSILSLLTKIASGYWRISDTQTSYTAVNLKSLRSIKLYDIYPYYGCPNDILVKLNIANCTLRELPSKPVYNVGEKSKMHVFKVIPKISLLLGVLFFKRLYTKYFFRDFHPLFVLYHLGIIMLLIDIIFFFRIVDSFLLGTYVSDKSTMAFIFLTISGFQSLFFAMWMDMMDNERLQK